MFLSLDMQGPCADAELVQQLKRVHLRKLGEVIVSPPARGEEQGLLAASLALARLLPSTPRTLFLCEWEASWENMVNGLGKLPSWTGELYLYLRACSEATKREFVARGIPDSYKTLVVNQYHLKPEECRAFVEAVGRYRTAKRPLTVKVGGGDVSWVKDVAERMAQEGTHPYVTVVTE